MQPFTPIKYKYFPTQSLGIMMDLCHLQTRFKIQLRLQSGTCIHNRFWQSIPISNCDSALFQNEFLLSCCTASALDVLGWNHHSTIFKLSLSLSAMLHYHYTISIHLYQMPVIFSGGKHISSFILKHWITLQTSIQDQVSNFVPIAHTFIPWTASDDQPTDSPPSVAS